MDKKKKRKHIEYGRYGYFFIAPFFIAYCLFQLWPLFNTFYYSTLSYYKRNGREFIEFCGLDNFKNILGLTAGEKGYALIYLKNTLAMWVCNFIPQILVSLLLAVWLTDNNYYLLTEYYHSSVCICFIQCNVFPVRTNYTVLT